MKYVNHTTTMLRTRAILSFCLPILLCAASWMRGAVYEDEAAIWQNAAAESPDKARPHNNLGHALKEKGNFKEAMGHFERAIQLNPDYPDALNNLATIYGNLGRRDEALALLHKTLSLEPNHIPARFNLAINYYEMGLLNDSLREYYAIIQIDPLSKQADFARQMIRLIQNSVSAK